MYTNNVVHARHPVTYARDPIVGVDAYPEMNNDPALGPAPAEDEPDKFIAPEPDALNRLRKGGHRVGKKMLQEFIYTPQALGFIEAGNNTTLVPWGSIALRTEEKIYRSDDEFVTNSEIRRVITRELLGPDTREVIWSENAGIVEIGSGLYGTLALPVDNPTGFGVAVNFGFDAVGLLVYRIIRPHALTREHDIKDITKGLIFEAPWDIKSASKLSKGTEIQFVGKGKLAAFEGIIIYEGLNMPGFLGVTTPGIGLYPVADQEKSREYSLKILALDGKGAVRVSVEKIHEKSAGLTLKLMAGLLSPTNNAVPQLGSGILAYLLQTAIENPLQNMLMNTWTVSINGSLSMQSKDDVLYCFDLDLKNPAHHEAYKNLIRLSVKEAQKLAADSQSGVRKVEWTENKHRTKRTVEIKAFSEQLFLHEASKIKRSGKLIRPDSSEVAYCDNIYRKKFLNIFTGKKDIRWQSIQLTKNNNIKENYYAFYYSHLNRIPHQEQVSRFFSFAKALDICSKVDISSELINISKRKRLFTSLDDVNTLVELYFTQAGVEKILKANAQEGMRAYLKNKCTNDTNFSLFPLNESLFLWSQEQFDLYYYYLHKNSTFRRPPKHIREARRHRKIHRIKKDYKKSISRDFMPDFKLYLEAKKFGSMVEKWRHASDKNNVAQFFTRMGRSSSFHYTDIIAALAELATRSNVLVHSFSMTGGGVSLKSIDEGKITHPRDEAWELANRAP